MAKKNNEVPNRDLVIEVEPVKLAGDKTVDISILNIQCDNTTGKAFRVYQDNGEQNFYRSSRLGTLDKTEYGFKADCTGFEKQIIGKRYEVCEVQTKDVVLTGKIVAKKAVAEKVVDIKTANA